ncbi:MAG: sigma-70 family RNA polymerase sigma factor, partial [Myxococcales bacterium]
MQVAQGLLGPGQRHRLGGRETRLAAEHRTPGRLETPQSAAQINPVPSQFVAEDRARGQHLSIRGKRFGHGLELGRDLDRGRLGACFVRVTPARCEEPHGCPFRCFPRTVENPSPALVLEGKRRRAPTMTTFRESFFPEDWPSRSACWIVNRDMSLLDRTPVEPSDAELIARVRGGDAGAYGELFARHRDAALRLARSLVRGPDADDLVSEAFAKVLKVLQGGRGPDLAFRAYLLTAVRRLNVDRARATQRATPTDDLEALDSGVPFIDPAVAGFEAGAAAKAFQSLPERWQLVLWHLEVEGQKPGDIAPLLGMSPNSVSVLAYRAREGLRQAFLQMHSAAIVDDDCEWTRGKLGAYVRGASSRRDAEKVQHHLESCRPCTAVYLELTEVNSSLAAVLGPLVLGGAAAAYLGGAAAGAGGLGVVGAFFGRVVDFVTANTQAAVVTGAAATVAVAGTVTLAVTHDDPAETSAKPPTPAVNSPAPAPRTPKARPAAPRSTPSPEPAPEPAPIPAAAPVPAPASTPEP